jgi:type III pantothenate kinase
MIENHWLALTIGNSRLQWAWFDGEVCKQVWDTPHLEPITAKKLIQTWNQGKLWGGDPTVPGTPWGIGTVPNPPLWVASVVPHQLEIWQSYLRLTQIVLEDLPLVGLYPTLGIDRALAVVGAASEWGWPVLAIDAGTALTFTGADPQQRLVGGAILPGFALQLQALADKTAALPPVEVPRTLPSRWGLTTAEAIASGVVYGIGSAVHDFIQDWWQQFPKAAVVITGGGRELVGNYLQNQAPAIAQRVVIMPDLIFYGMRYIKQQQSG